ADPALGHIRLIATFGSCLNRILRLLLCTDKQHWLATGRYLGQERQRFLKRNHGLLKVDDVTILPLAMDVWRHLRVPSACFVSEVDASFKQLLNIDSNCHIVSLLLPHLWLCNAGANAKGCVI